GDRLRADPLPVPPAGHGGRRLMAATTVLFLCVHNAGRSQMAAGWLRHLAGDRVVVASGGSRPAADVNPVAVAAMAAVGGDIAGASPQRWTDGVAGGADIVVTMGGGDACPIVAGARVEDWSVDDPAGLALPAVRAIRDDIRRRVEALVAALPPLDG